MESKFRVGEEVLMDRKASFFKKAVADLDKNTLLWWGELEEMQPLIIREIRELDKIENQFGFEGTEYMVMESWIKPNYVKK